MNSHHDRVKPTRLPQGKQELVLGIPIHAVSFDDATTRIMEWGRERLSRYVVFANAHVVIAASQNPLLGTSVAGADLVAPDGAPIAWMLQRLGVEHQTRVSGPDMMWALLGHCEHQSLPVYFYGSTTEILDRLKMHAMMAFPQLKIAGLESPPFRAPTTQEDLETIHRINTSGAGLLFIGLGCPKQEIWMNAHVGRVNAVMLGVGAGFDFHAGAVTRAPPWMRKSGLEWLHRLSMEPKRLWHRYLVTNTLFIFGAIRQLAAIKKIR